MIDFSNVKLFNDANGNVVSYEDLLRDIYNNTNETRESVRFLVDKITALINNPSDGVMMLESIARLIDARVKNDDLLLKMASIISRIVAKNVSTKKETSDWEISDDEKKQLLAEAESLLEKTMGKTG